jgi:hypothetical protein
MIRGSEKRGEKEEKGRKRKGRNLEVKRKNKNQRHQNKAKNRRLGGGGDLSFGPVYRPLKKVKDK